KGPTSRRAVSRMRMLTGGLAVHPTSVTMFAEVSNRLTISASGESASTIAAAPGVSRAPVYRVLAEGADQPWTRLIQSKGTAVPRAPWRTRCRAQRKKSADAAHRDGAH